MTNSIVIDHDGVMTGMDSPLTRSLNLERRRASQVEPVNTWLRWLFHSIRRRVKEDSFLAEFTRKWPCQWQARIFNGPTFGPFKSRKTAIATEIVFLEVLIEKGRYGSN